MNCHASLGDVGPTEWTEEEKALLLIATPPIPLNRTTIERCLRAAAVERDRRRRRRRIALAFVAALIAGFVVGRLLQTSATTNPTEESR